MLPKSRFFSKSLIFIIFPESTNPARRCSSFPPLPAARSSMARMKFSTLLRAISPKKSGKGRRWVGGSGIAGKTGFQSVEPIANLHADLARIAKSYSNFYTLFPPKEEEGYPHFTVSAKSAREALPDSGWKDATPLLDAMRQVKSPGELEPLEKAIDVSIDAQLDAMEHIHPGLFEYQVAARMKEIHEMGGCSRKAYAPIVGTGFNSTVLHYSGLNDQLKDGDVASD